MRLILILSLFLVYAVPGIAQANDLSAAYTALRLQQFERAFEIFSLEAKQGSSEAQYQLGKLYAAGRGSPVDLERATYWFEKAASAGESGAQYALGLQYLQQGELKAAHGWLQQAADAGHAQAKSELEQLDSTSADHSDTQTVPGNDERLFQQWFKSSANCDTEKLKHLRKKGANVNWQDEYQRNALYYLTACKNLRGVKYLVLEGIAPDLVDTFGDSALHLAIRNDHEKILQVILSAVGELPSSRNLDTSLLHIAVAQKSYAALEVLLKSFALEKRWNNEANTAYDLASLNDDKQAMLLLQKYGARHSSQWQKAADDISPVVDLDSIGNVWKTARQAVLQNQTRALSTLLESRGSELLATVDASDRSLLMYASQSSSLNAMGLLIKKGAEINQANSLGETALHLSAKLGATKAVGHLLRLGADPTIRDQSKRDAVLIAMENQHDRAAKLILMTNPGLRGIQDGTYLVSAVENQASESALWLLAKRSEVSKQDTRGRTALWYAAQRCEMTILSRVLRVGKTEDIADQEGFTALHAAAVSGCTRAIAPLLAAGLEINAKTKLGNTPLLLATQKRHIETVTTLINAGANPEAQNQTEDTALIIAVRTGNKRIAETLLQLGSDPFRRNILGESAASLAEIQGGEIAKLF